MNDGQDRIIRIRAVLARTGLTRSTLYRKLCAGTFPPSIKIADRCVGWRESAIDRWIEQSGSDSGSLAQVHSILQQLRGEGV